MIHRSTYAAALGAVSVLFLSCSTSVPAPLTATDAGGQADNDAGLTLPPWLPSARVFVSGHAADNIYLDCRAVICRHNENTDMTTYNGAIYLVHRTAISQALGPNSALHIYRSTDGGVTFTETARIDAPVDRDIRDPCFYTVNGELFIKALTRVTPPPEDANRDTGVDTVAVAMHSSDGAAWTPLINIGPHGYSFWRVKEQNGVFHTAAYQDGDKQIILFTSSDGLIWTQGAPVYTIRADTPVETELTFMLTPADAGAPPDGGAVAAGGPLLALVRMDGADTELLGDEGRLRTKVCWAMPPYSSFDCSNEIDGQRLDGPLTFVWNSRLFVIARKHLQGTGRKRTSLFELTGPFDGSGPFSIKEWGELPSAGDTSYAGIAMTDPTHALVSWYSGDLVADRPWVLAMFDLTDIWLGTIDFTKLQ